MPEFAPCQKELWLQAEDLSAFNENIIEQIEVIGEFPPRPGR